MTPDARSAPPRVRLRVEIRGAVQGVGFRPFVYRLATTLSLAGWVINDSRGVFLEVEGPAEVLDRFLEHLRTAPPPQARIHSLDARRLEPAGYSRFEIRPSDAGGEKRAVLLPEIASCPDCLAEILDPRERRHRYPFTNCTNCGPRFTIIRALPYDRPATTMSGFPLCPDCRREYEDPSDRRFHAQPIACPACGPRLAFSGRDGRVLATGDDALARAVTALRAGEIVAVKGIGGFHLMCDATNSTAVRRLREVKPRREKPLALMVPDLAAARGLCEFGEAAERVLASPEAPIVLLPRRVAAPVCAEVAPGLPTLGVMLPATPLHHLLLAGMGRAVVATSGNRSDEPIATDDAEAHGRLGEVAEWFLGHDRPIERHVDDSVGWFAGGTFALLRRARGYAPLPVRVAGELPPLLAVGAHLKNTVALAVGRQVFLSQHIGDLETPEAIGAFERVIADFLRLYEVRPSAIAHDLHPDYASTQWARRAAETPWGAAPPVWSGTEGRGEAPRLVAVQHHHAHLAACLAENGVEGKTLGVIWDGTGYGPDTTIWGGEFLVGDAAEYERLARLRPFRLPGGETAVREPRRTALALVYGALGAAAFEREDLACVASFTAPERTLLRRLLETGAHAPVTTSAGRLFDGVAALIGLHPEVSFEGQAAMGLEALATGEPAGTDAYPLPLVDVSEAAPGATPCRFELDWRPLVHAVLEDLARGTPRSRIAARFHAALIEAAAAVAHRAGIARVALSGGCFQNRLLVEGLAARLEARGHAVLRHRQVPPNDGGISLGQIAVAAARLRAS